MADDQTSNIGLFELVHRVRSVEENTKKMETDLYKGNGKSALIVRMAEVEINLEAQTALMKQEADANRKFREIMYNDIQALKSEASFQKGKDAAEDKNSSHQIKTVHLIVGVLAMIGAPVIAEFVIHALRW